MLSVMFVNILFPNEKTKLNGQNKEISHVF